MSEFISNTEKRLQDLLAFSLGMMNGEPGRELMEKYAEAINSLSPHDMLRLEDRQLQMGITASTIKKDIDKVMNTFFRQLSKYPWKRPEAGSFLYYLMLENEAFGFKLNQIKKVLKSYSKREAKDFEDLRSELLPRFEELTGFEWHYVKKENILFPYLEKKWETYRPLKVMWSLHDDARKMLKELISLLKDNQVGWEEINPKIGKYFFMAFGIIQKEELVIYPVAAETITTEEWLQMHIQSFEFPFAFIETPDKTFTENQKTLQDVSGSADEIASGLFITETGTLNMEQLELILNHLPADVTFVDEHDKVRYFSRPEDRFFPRSPAIIGRDVRNCHPPESVHIVEQIITGFRSGTHSTAKFWINLKGRFILIQYYALRNSKGEYKGVLEMSMDATEIRALQGEQRLLDWA
ncbi:MAG: PAS domain-containing protein [Bacteroidales bacterium]|jgi:DUF438 domain-containing protein|nr:PAS domain-containing protein [Bacteroidales bacterium]HOI31224.1 PAS domain-containing protein [Bacteroidales bacterium]